MLLKTRYEDNGRLAIVKVEEETEEIDCVLTVNLEDNLELTEYMAYLDINNHKRLVKSLKKEYEIVGWRRSGFVEYPLVVFNESFVDNLKKMEM